MKVITEHCYLLFKSTRTSVWLLMVIVELHCTEYSMHRIYEVFIENNEVLVGRSTFSSLYSVNTKIKLINSIKNNTILPPLNCKIVMIVTFWLHKSGIVFELARKLKLHTGLKGIDGWTLATGRTILVVVRIKQNTVR